MYQREIDRLQVKTDKQKAKLKLLMRDSDCVEEKIREMRDTESVKRNKQEKLLE